MDGERVSGDVRAFGMGIPARDLLIERLSTRMVRRGRVRSRGRVELSEKRGDMIDPGGGVREPKGVDRPASLQTGLELGRRALVQQGSHLTVGGRHEGWGDLPAPRSRTPRVHPAAEYP